MRVLDHLLKTVRDAAVFNPGVQVAPACILWAEGAGVLLDKPNIKWGKDVESAPWYHLGPLYGGKEGDRINDHHLRLEEKRRAKEEKS